VCTHRTPDEEMWSLVMEAGASDFCHNSDVRSIVMAATRDPHLANGAAA